MSKLSLHSLCREGKQKELETYFSGLGNSDVEAILKSFEGPFKYTLVHTAALYGHASLLHFLLSKGAGPNVQASNGWTALHLAASSGRVECVKVLLTHNGDPCIVDEHGKTPRQLTSLKNITRWLANEEIVRTVERNGSLTQLFSEFNVDEMRPDALDRALVAAVRLNNMENISALLMKGAGIEKALDAVDKDRNHVELYVTLLLVKAAVSNDCDLAKILHGQVKVFPEWIHSCVLEGKLSYILPIQMALQTRHPEVMGELLIRTGVQGKSVDWSHLRLQDLAANVIERIDFVEHLTLKDNCLRTLPPMSNLKQLVKAELQSNSITSVPASLLELPLLKHLNLSDNRLTTLPELSEWSPSLITMDLSHNRLSTIPGEPLAPSIRTLNLADNDFRTVPLCVCGFVTLRSLDLSDNKNILSLPPQMGKLKELTALNLKGLKDLNEPPKNVQNDVSDCIRYLKNKLLSARGFYRMKLMLVGKQNRGKTTLVARLQGRDCGNESTVGVDVSEWEYRPAIGKRPFSFSIWDFGGQEEYYATHQCFLSERSLYLVLFNLKDGDAGVEELKPWLDNIALRAPKSCVFIVGTHLDEFPARDRAYADKLLKSAAAMASKFSGKLQTKEVLGVGLKKQLENVNILRESIYNCAAQYEVEREPVMGQMVPASYHILDKHIQDLQKEVRIGAREPIMHREEYKSLICQLNLSDIQDEDELKTATLFLNNVGTLLHYDDRSHNLDELYFIDPRWLCDMMAKIVTVKEKNPFIADGILHIKNVPFLLHDQKFPAKYFKQYLTLLDRFEVAFALDSQRIIIPSLLPKRRPAGIDIRDPSGHPLYTRYVLFTSTCTPPGFWSRLISRIMHSVSRLQFILDQHIVPSDKSTPDEWGTGSMFEHEEDGPDDIVCSLKQMDLSQVRMQYWHTGIFYNDGEVQFRVESLRHSKQCTRENREGVLIAASPNIHGRMMIGQLVDLTASLFRDWYQGGTVEQVVPCYECMKMKRPLPFEFRTDSCLALIAKNQSAIQCQYSRHDSLKNHTASLLDIVPDLLLFDLSPQFVLKSSDFTYEENRESILGKGGYGTVYRGVCRGQPVAIKKYQSIDAEDSFSELRREAILLEKFHHPCLVCLVGVCVHPSMALVLEEAPMGSLERPLIKLRQAIHRVVIHRIAAQVAAAIRFLHNSGIIFRDLKAANVLLWSLDPESLCHCKVTDFGIATYAAPVGARGLHGTKGFIAPEVLHLGRKKSDRPVYTNQADIFSFGMLLYQMIARRHPFQDMAPVKIDSAVDSGERPKLLETPQAETALFYLTRLMQRCWDANPSLRPTTNDIIEGVCSSPFQSVMTIQPARSRWSLRHACVSVDLVRVGVGNRQEPELWVCCDGDEGTEVSVYATNTMSRLSKSFIKDNQVQCISLCGDHVWVATRVGIESGVITIYNASTKEQMHSIPLEEHSVTCMSHSESLVYCGTLEGFVLAFSRDMKQLKASKGPQLIREIGDYTIDGILATKGGLWVSHTHFIHFLNLTTLAVEGTLKPTNAYVGQLKLSLDGATIWSAHLSYHNTGTYLTAWSFSERKELFHVDIKEQLKGIDPGADQKVAITAMTPALDTVWVGMSTGHILVFHEAKLLTWFCPYKEYVRFLVCIPSEGPCRTEKAMVVSGAKEFRSPLIPGLPDYDKMDEKGVPVDKGGTLIIWEAFPSKMCRQISMIQSQSSTFLDSHHTVKQVIEKGEFRDGTCLLKDGASEGVAEGVTDESVVASVPGLITTQRGDNEPEVSTTVTTVNGKRMDGFDTLLSPTVVTEAVMGDPLPPLPEEPAEPVLLKTHISSTNVETMDVMLPDGVTAVRVSCVKPAQLQAVLTQLETNSNLTAVAEKFQLTYRLDEPSGSQCFVIDTQLDLVKYVEFVKRPELFLVAKELN